MHDRGVFGAATGRIWLGALLCVTGGAACSSEQRAVPDPPGGNDSGTTGLFTLASGQNTPYVIAIDSSRVYWTNYGSNFGSSDGAVMAVPIAGGTPTTLASGINAANGIGVDGTGVYFGGLPMNATSTSLMKVPLNGGAFQILAGFFMDDPFAVGPDGVFGTGSENGGDLTIMRVPLAGGTATPIVPSTSLPQTASSYGIAVDAASVYWTSFRNPCVVYKAPLAGGLPTTLATVSGPCYGIAVDARRVYFAATSGVQSVSIDGGTTATLALSPGSSVAIDDDFVYFTSSGSDVSKVSKTGGAVTSLATGQDQAAGIAVDANSVYWVNTGSAPGTGSVMKLTPK
jgi:hypothetical protein